MNWRKIIRWAMPILGLIPFVPVTIAILNIENLAAEKGWDQFLTKNWEWIVSNLSQIGQNPWFLIFFGLMIGGSLFMWADYFIRRYGVEQISDDTLTQVMPPGLAHKIDRVRELLDSTDNFDDIKKSSYWGFIEINLTDWEKQKLTPPAMSASGIGIDPSQLQGEPRKFQIVSQMLARLEQGRGVE